MKEEVVTECLDGFNSQSPTKGTAINNSFLLFPFCFVSILSPQQRGLQFFLLCPLTVKLPVSILSPQQRGLQWKMKLFEEV